MGRFAELGLEGRFGLLIGFRERDVTARIASAEAAALGESKE